MGARPNNPKNFIQNKLAALPALSVSSKLKARGHFNNDRRSEMTPPMWICRRIYYFSE